VSVQNPVVPTYLALLDAQREAAFTALEGLDPAHLWQRPAPREWCLGELLNHVYLLNASAMPYVRFAWWALRWVGERRRHKPYRDAMPDLYRDGKFPMWTGFLWTPRYHPRHPVPLSKLLADLRALHSQIAAFYTGKDETVLGNISIYDPYFGSLNLILTLRLGIYHDQLHYDDVIKLAHKFKTNW
jgi:hypothetical protein